jgi:hypothetical protein
MLRALLGPRELMKSLMSTSSFLWSLDTLCTQTQQQQQRKMLRQQVHQDGGEGMPYYTREEADAHGSWHFKGQQIN